MTNSIITDELNKLISKFIQEANLELAYSDKIHLTSVMVRIEDFSEDKSGEEQRYIVNAIYDEAFLNHKKNVKFWSNHPLTEFLDKLRNLPANTGVVISTSLKSSHKQQILFLDYLGILDKINTLKITQEKQAELISYIINRGTKNTKTLYTTRSLRYDKKSLTDVVKSPKNLEFVQNIFRNLGLDDLVEKVQKDKDDINEH